MPVEDAIRLAREGRLLVPRFQRSFRWTTADRRALLDSIYRGYPVGTLLLWKNEDADGRQLAPEASPIAPGERFLVVDGQQRLTTLWEALGRRPARRETALLFDLERDEVVSRALRADELDGVPPPPRDRDEGLPQVPAYLVLDAALLAEWVPSWLSLDDRRRYYELGKRIREYRLGLYVVEHADVEALRHVFDRINTSGKSMSRDEVFNALIGSRVAEGGEAGLALVNARLSDLGFGAIPPLTILKSLEAIRGDKVGHLNPRSLDARAAETSLDETARALRATLRFLRDEARIPHYAVLPYELPLVVLARFFARHPHPTERSRILLRRWIWRGSLGERLGGASGSIQQHVDDISDEESSSVQALLRRTGSPAELSLDDATWERASTASASSARGKMLVCALLARQTRDLTSGERIEIESLFRDGVELRPIIRHGAAGVGVANRLVHPSGGAPLQLILDCGDEAALISHGIAVDAVDALRRGDVETFFARRDAVLRPFTLKFLAKNAELERDDAPSLASLARRSA